MTSVFVLAQIYYQQKDNIQFQSRHSSTPLSAFAVEQPRKDNAEKCPHRDRACGKDLFDQVSNTPIARYLYHN